MKSQNFTKNLPSLLSTDSASAKAVLAVEPYSSHLWPTVHSVAKLIWEESSTGYRDWSSPSSILFGCAPGGCNAQSESRIWLENICHVYGVLYYVQFVYVCVWEDQVAQ